MVEEFDRVGGRGARARHPEDARHARHHGARSASRVRRRRAGARRGAARVARRPDVARAHRRIATIGWGVAVSSGSRRESRSSCSAPASASGSGRRTLPVLSSLLTDTYPIQARGRGLRVLAWRSPIGLLIGPFVAGAIADAAGGDEGWRWTYFILVDSADPARVVLVASARAGAWPLRAGDRARRELEPPTSAKSFRCRCRRPTRG